MKAQRPRCTESITRDKINEKQMIHGSIVSMIICSCKLVLLSYLCPGVLLKLQEMVICAQSPYPFISNFMLYCFFIFTVVFLTDPERSFHCARIPIFLAK